VAERPHLAEVFEVEGASFAAADGGHDVVRGDARLADGVLRRRRAAAPPSR
jgi:hypothetical protein